MPATDALRMSERGSSWARGVQNVPDAVIMMLPSLSGFALPVTFIASDPYLHARKVLIQGGLSETRLRDDHWD